MVVGEPACAYVIFNSYFLISHFLPCVLVRPLSSIAVSLFEGSLFTFKTTPIFPGFFSMFLSLGKLLILCTLHTPFSQLLFGGYMTVYFGLHSATRASVCAGSSVLTKHTPLSLGRAGQYSDYVTLWLFSLQFSTLLSVYPSKMGLKAMTAFKFLRFFFFTLTNIH